MVLGVIATSVLSKTSKPAWNSEASKALRHPLVSGVCPWLREEILFFFTLVVFFLSLACLGHEIMTLGSDTPWRRIAPLGGLGFCTTSVSGAWRFFSTLLGANGNGETEFHTRWARQL